MSHYPHLIIHISSCLLTTFYNRTFASTLTKCYTGSGTGGHIENDILPANAALHCHEPIFLFTKLNMFTFMIACKNLPCSQSKSFYRAVNKMLHCIQQPVTGQHVNSHEKSILVENFVVFDGQKSAIHFLSVSLLANIIKQNPAVSHAG
ncbi:hypothetical protein HELRODRAFT_173031 [Helobdella robusta]|uniref:Uncharacterized protein n=1 Tax=Helobdella robusta TaxID=6412 RepID=T1F6A3_HELRO|nr:hypothetical protein HELRODRAFT_173031 [Helobdella robusta]ESO03985.1 hypothetical protein HELRODRAFT_173031 [Helobdella robusta]